MGALCYSELGTSVLSSGGDYAYIRESLGGLPGFLYLWVAIVVIMPTGNAIGALTFAYYILQPIFPTCEPPESAVRLIAALAISECSLLVFSVLVGRHKGHSQREARGHGPQSSIEWIF